MLTPTEILNGIFSVIIVLVFLLVGLLTVSKYRKTKNRTYFWWGVGLLGLGLPWSGSGVSFLLIILTGEGLSVIPYFFISLSWMVITLFFWMCTMTELMYKDKQKIILSLYAILGFIFEIYFIYYLIVDSSIIGELSNNSLDATYRGLTMIFTLFATISVAFSLLLFIRESFFIEDPEIKLKAKFLLIGIISFVFGSLADAFIPLNIVAILVVRTILLCASLEFYIGWNLPESLKKLFLKNQ
jgi:hypothetical protein